MRQSKISLLIIIILCTFCLYILYYNIILSKKDETNQDFKIRGVLSYYIKNKFEKIFLQKIDNETKIIPVNMNQSLFLGPDKNEDIYSTDYRRHFYINGAAVPSYINYKVQSKLGDSYLSVASSKFEGNNCLYITNTKKQLYIWQQPEYSIITEESKLSHDVFKKPYCYSIALPENSKIEVRKGSYDVIRGIKSFNINTILPN